MDVGESSEIRRHNRFERFGVGPVEQPDAAEQANPSTMARAWELPEASRRGSMTPFSPIWDEIAGAKGVNRWHTSSAKAKQRRLLLWMRRFSQQCRT